MKRLSGGLVLLNLTAISLALTSGEVDITDAGILEELTELRQFIDVNRDFSKGFKNLKPIIIEYRSSASKFNGITQANLSFNTDALHMSIGANTIQADGKLLVITINVVYEYTDYVGYTIKSAKLNAYETLADGDATFTGDVGIGGDLEITGDASVGGDIEVAETSKVKIFDNIVDSGNNKRFISFDGTPSSNAGVHSAFCKATLSGTHLMFVFAGTIDDTTEIANGHALAVFGLPDWIMDKIYPVWSSQYIESKSVPAYNDDWTSQSLEIVLQKIAYGIQFTNVGSFVADKERNFRIAFDLVIDADYE